MNNMATRPNSIQRSLSESTSTFVIEDDSLGRVISEGLRECWNEELFFDIDVFTMEQRVVKCHKIVLASVSPFFKAAFSPMHQGSDVATKDHIELPNVPYDIMKFICEFIYNRSVDVPVKDLQDLIVAANFLQLHSLEEKCAKYLHDYTDETTFLEISRFAKQVGIIPSIDFCRTFVETKFDKILSSGLIYDFTEDELEQVLRDYNIVVKDSHGCAPPPSIQEKIIFETIINFVNMKFASEEGKRHEVFDNLVRHVRFISLMKYECDSLVETVIHLEDRALAVKCTNLLQNAGDYTTPTSVRKVSSSRSGIALNSFKSTKLAHGYETVVKKRFDDQPSPTDLYIKGMKIWIRRWDGRPVYGGIEVLYSDGQKTFHGERFNHEVHEFVLAPDEYIVKVITFSGYMVDNLEFITNTGRSYGPYGGDGGGRRILCHPGGSGYLSHVSGSVVSAQGSLGIASLVFHFVLCPEPGYKRDPGYYQEDYEHLRSFTSSEEENEENEEYEEYEREDLDFHF